ncbi:hypothetical protein [Profundibacter sp.]
MDKQLLALQNLTGMVLDAERMKLQQIALAERKLKEQIMELDIESRKRSGQLLAKGGTDQALLAGADMRWQSWLQQQKRKLNTRRAALLAKYEEQRQKAQKAFGKDKAVRKLLEQSSEEARVKSGRV